MAEKGGIKPTQERISFFKARGLKGDRENKKGGKEEKYIDSREPTKGDRG